ncbi:amidase signature enzyme [Auricularia subglabra TFB-10046 SS5]|uniref:Amidase signature enzyme n=1 Tax=Auricularia subglabra (strain TFB-10046 / SS5) TaxID=717982 RepID=J0WT25_AURST|nr:amidase signature enzyme [Auricularia subglabra TFB-10046 SS5]
MHGVWLLRIIFNLHFVFAFSQAGFGPHPLPDLYEASITELQAGLARRDFTSFDLVQAYIARIDEVNQKGPSFRAVLEINRNALKDALVADAERLLGLSNGPLHGIPVLLKDNIATFASEGMNTTAGSFALEGSVPPRDATVTAKLRRAGAIILGKANLSEWAHFRGNLASGWSGRGGQCTSAFFPNADPSGSSSGSAVAASIGLAAVTLGSETDGSIISPSSKNNLVGIKPTVGLTSRAGGTSIIPISSNQDTVGPLVRSVADAAIVLSAIAGRDPRDAFTLAQPARVPDYTRALQQGALRGARIGVPRTSISGRVSAPIAAAFESALDTLRGLGAVIVDPADLPSAAEMRASGNESIVLDTDFKVEVAQYMAGLTRVPTGVRTLADLITFNSAHPDLELPPPFFNSQSTFIQAEATTGKTSPAYLAALAANHDLGRTRGIDAALQTFNLSALVLPSSAVRARVIVRPPDAFAFAVPLGFLPDDTPVSQANPTIASAPGLPFGLAFMGTAFSEFALIGLAFDFEQATHVRTQRRAFAAAVPKTQLADVIGNRPGKGLRAK